MKARSSLWSTALALCFLGEAALSSSVFAQNLPGLTSYAYTDENYNSQKIVPISSAIPSAEWNWGELAYSRTYDTKLEIPSDCPCPVLVTIEPHHVPHPPLGEEKRWDPNARPTSPSQNVKMAPGNPYLTIPASVTVPPGGGNVDAKINTPAPPPIPRNPQGVAVNDLTLVEGWLALKGQEEQGCSCQCRSSRVIYLDGHIHLDPASGGSGKEPATAPPDCRRFWEEEEEPPPEVEDQCLDMIRGIARDYIGTELGPAREEDPDRWSWLPEPSEIGRMSIRELLDMKSRAEAQLRTRGR